jgi:6-phosphofructokinase 1
MNAAIRAVVRSALSQGIECVGIFRGYEGMIDGEFMPLVSQSVSNIIQRGGTILKSARSAQFREKAGRDLAYEQLKANDIEYLVGIGGDGTFKGGLVFTDEHPDIKFIGLPGTIDNDLYGTDYTIGYDTAVNTVVDCIDKIRDTAASHDRLFFVEVMGRDAGFIALRSGIASGADAILIPEYKTDLDGLVATLKNRHAMRKTSNIVVVSEGDDQGGAFEIVSKVKDRLQEFEIKVTVLGHLQRGGNPSSLDRMISSQMGVAAVKALLSGKNRIMIGVQCGQTVEIPLEKATKHHNTIKPGLIELANTLSSI